MQVFFTFTLIVLGCSNAFAQTSVAPQKTPVQAQCDVVKQVLFLVDVSGSMETNDRLNEAKQFMLRTAKENSAKNYLYKLISFGGSCNEIQTDVDWTRDGTIFSAGVKGLYLRGGTPLGSAMEFTMDEIKKSAYPDQTKVILLNDGANACGDVNEILTRRLKEIPCVRFISIGIELDDDENGLASRAIADAKALATQTSGSYIPLRDVREIRGVSLNDTAVVVRSVEFEPRKKPEVAQQSAQTQPAQNQSAQNQPAQTQPAQNQSSSQPTQSQTAQSSTQSSQTASQTPANTASPNRPDSSVQAEKQPQSTTPQSAPSQSTTSQSTSSQGAVPKESASTPASSSEKTSAVEPMKQENRQSSSQSSQADSRPANDSVKPASSRAGQSQAPQADKLEPSASSARAQERSTPSGNSSPQGYNAFRTQGKESRVQENESRAQGNESRMQGSKGNAETVVLRFMLGSTRLLEDSRTALTHLEMELRVRPARRIEVDGHSSGEGSSAANLRLSVERASAIANILRKQTGMSEERVRWTGYGELRPMASTVRFGNSASRRVEIRLYR